LFEERKEEQGLYRIQLFESGQKKVPAHLLLDSSARLLLTAAADAPQVITIDDRLAVVRHRAEMFFGASVHQNEFWVSLLEKAYAKHLMGYDLMGKGKA